MSHLEKLTLLHSNDLHGDFTAEQVDQELIGGVSRLSGYINKVRNEEKNVIYSISGDMFRGSLIDSEFQGISTIEIMNMLAPDVVTLGNHEVDYGLAHILFLDKCASFPIINANMHLKHNGVRLFNSHFTKVIDGMRVLFIGILTEDVLNATKAQGLIGTLVDIEDAATEVGKICDAYRTADIDLCVLLTHIGIEEDKKLAARLDPTWGVDIIIGGHSHTLLDEPCVVAGIPIVQAAVGTDQIGRFDLIMDTDNNRIDSYTWQCIPITSANCPTDPSLETLIKEYDDYTNAKYARILTRFLRTYTHPSRHTETELGDLLAECFRDQLDVDLMILGSGSIRFPELGPIVTLGDVTNVFPYNDPLYKVMLTGAQLRHALMFMLRDEAFAEDTHAKWYQFSKGFLCEYDKPTHTILSLKINGKEVTDDNLYSVVLERYHCVGMGEYLDIPPEEVERKTQIASEARNVLEEYFISHPLIELDGTPRIVIHAD